MRIVPRLLALAAVLAVAAVQQFLVWTPPAAAATVWLDDEPVDPNLPDEGDNPQPENVGAGSWVGLDDEPTDPNVPDEADNPQPESIGAGLRVWLDDEPTDPNLPDEQADPQPEAAAGRL